MIINIFTVFTIEENGIEFNFSASRAECSRLFISRRGGFDSCIGSVSSRFPVNLAVSSRRSLALFWQVIFDLILGSLVVPCD
jgi:hypothetical protein